MSIRLMTLAWELKIPATPKIVLLALCDWANDEGKRAITSGNSAIGKAIVSTAAGTARAANQVVKKGFEMARKKSLSSNTVRAG